jgi:hypothetical protein
MVYPVDGLNFVTNSIGKVSLSLCLKTRPRPSPRPRLAVVLGDINGYLLSMEMPHIEHRMPDTRIFPRHQKQRRALDF